MNQAKEQLSQLRDEYDGTIRPYKKAKVMKDMAMCYRSVYVLDMAMC